MCVAVPILSSIFVSVSLPVQAWVCFHSEIGICVWRRCVSCLSPSVTVLWPRNARGTHLGPCHLWEPHRHSTGCSPSCDGVASPAHLVVLVMVTKGTSTAIRELWQNKFHDSQVLEGHKDTSQGHTARSWGEKESKLGFCLYGGKSEVTQVFSYLGHPGLSKRGTSRMQGGLTSSSRVSGTVCIQDR